MNYSAIMNQYIAKSDSLLKDLFFKIAPLYKEEFGREQDAPIFLFTALHSTSESILILLLHKAVFDADVLLRTVMEGTVKYCYLMSGNPSVRSEKYMEYKIKLTDIDDLSDHFKAKTTIEVLKEYSTNSLKPFECFILDSDEVLRLENQYPKNVRNELKRRWGYQTLLRDLAKRQPEYQAQIGSISTYSLTSHFSHFDWTGVSHRQKQIQEVALTGDETLDVGHALRVLSNVLSMAVFRVAEYMRGNQYNSPEVVNHCLEVLSFIAEIDKIQMGIVNSHGN